MNDRADRPGPPAIFHEKRTYRQRRVMDAARVMPILAIFLWCLPLVWPQTGEDAVSSATALIYIFVVWGLVIVLAWGLSRALRHAMDDGTDGDS